MKAHITAPMNSPVIPEAERSETIRDRSSGAPCSRSRPAVRPRSRAIAGGRDDGWNVGSCADGYQASGRLRIMAWRRHSATNSPR